MRWTVYMLRCADGTLYTGVTTDLHRRLRQHNGLESGGAKYTRSRRPCRIAYTRLYLGSDARSLALRREAEIKAMSKTEKEKWAV